MVASILDEIIAVKRAELVEAQRFTPLSVLQERVQRADPPRGFHTAVAHRGETGPNLIAEIKRQSPSAGLIRPDLDPAAIAQIYQQAGAAAISVLTDERYFGGRLEHIAAVRRAVPLPVLRKDFLVDAYQVWEARAAGADAVLLIAEVLGAEAVVELAALAAELGMTTLVEAHTGQQLEKAVRALGPQAARHVLIGINNRDLAVQKTDIETTVRLARLVGDSFAMVSESGIRTRQDVLTVLQAGARAILVGETLLKAPDIAAKIDELLGRAAL